MENSIAFDCRILEQQCCIVNRFDRPLNTTPAKQLDSAGRSVWVGMQQIVSALDRGKVRLMEVDELLAKP
jgi:hypothetical protein